MARPPWVLQLRNSRDTTEQIASMKAIKNGIIGHPLKKEIAVSQGLLEQVVRLTARQNSRQDGKSHDHSFVAKPLIEEEVIRLQGLHILASIALGGPSFLAPLNSALALQAILSNLCPSNNPAQIVLASLRAISNMVTSATLDPILYTPNASAIADALFVRQHLSSLTRILSQSSASSIVQNQINTAASLISSLCHDERYQQSIAASGILDALATRLASFVVAEGLVLPGADTLARRDGLLEHFPAPAPQNANLPVILHAISSIITDSKLRASQLLYSPSILAVFPNTQALDILASQGKAAWNSFSEHPSKTRRKYSSPLDYLLPSMPLQNHKHAHTQPSAFPPLGTSASRENLATNGRSSSSQHNGDSLPVPEWLEPEISKSSAYFLPEKPSSEMVEEPESPLAAYLIYILRSRGGIGRLAAASVLAVLYRMGLTHKSRETAIGVLVIPLLLDLLHSDPICTNGRDSLTDEEILSETKIVREKVPGVLAMLITDNEYLQKAAFDAHAIPRLCTMLKMAYGFVRDSANPGPWCPAPLNGKADDDTKLSVNLGLSPLLIHNVRVRESTLKAIAAIVPFKDEYRKVVVDEGLIPYIVESMNSEPGKPTPKSNDKSDNPTNSPSDEESKKGYGVNPVTVIIAACGAIRALSRSVSILRTTLIDNGIAAPVITLLRHSDIEIQIAATATMCNLVTDISPMRDMIAQAGVVKILCEHAHSTNARLRLNAVWALKHFVNAVPNDLKRQCVEELGQGWLVQLICDDTEDEALLSSKEKSDKGTANDELDEDVEMDQFEDQVETAFASSFGRTTNSRPSSSRSKSIRQAELRLAALRDAETNPQHRARKDDLAVQEQGLSFIRNLIGPTGSAANSEVTEMVDFLFSALGQDRVFEILASKLRPKVYNPYPRHTNQRTSVQLPQPEIVVAVTMILVHMAASVPRHRQIVIVQTGLLQLLADNFHHPNMEIRLALCHLATNLTWLDDQNDSKACLQRTRELVNLAYLEKLESLEQDVELNVRERAKIAVWQMKQSLGY